MYGVDKIRLLRDMFRYKFKDMQRAKQATVSFVFNNTVKKVMIAFDLLKALEVVSKKYIVHCFPCVDDQIGDLIVMRLRDGRLGCCVLWEMGLLGDLFVEIGCG